MQTGRGWMLHEGDAYFYRGEVRRPERACTPGLDAYQRMMEVDHRQRMDNQARIRRLSLDRRREVRVICAHDAVEFEQCAAGHPL